MNLSSAQHFGGIGSFFLQLCKCLFYLVPLATVSQDYNVLKYSREDVEKLPFVITHYGAKQKLPQSQVSCMMKDNKCGALIMSTAYGLVTFDGVSIYEYSKHPYYGRMIFYEMMRSKRIKAPLGFNSYNQLVILSENPKVIGRYGDVDISEDNWSVIDFDGTISWYEKSDFNKIKKFNTGVLNPMFLRRLDDHNFIVSSQEGSFLVNILSGKKDKLTADTFKAGKLTPDKQSYFLISENSIYEWGSAKGLRLVYRCDMDCNFSDIEVVSERILVSSLSGLYIMEGNNVNHFDHAHNFPSDELVSVFYDSSQYCVFIGSGNKGLLKLQNRRFRTIYGGKDGLTGGSGPMSPGEDHCFWFTNRNKVYEMKNGQFSEFVSYENAATSLLYVRDTLIISTWSPEIIYKSVKHKSKQRSIRNISTPIITLYSDRRGSIWAGNLNGVLKGTNIFNLQPFLPEVINKSVTKFFESSSGLKFLGGYDGIYLLNQENRLVAVYGEESGFTKNGVRSFLEDAEGNVWIGTYGDGLFCYSKGKMVSLKNTPNYLLGNDIFSLTRSPDGHILMTSNSGMRMVHEASLHDFLKGKIDYLVPFVFGETDGILNPEFNGGFQHNSATTDSIIYYFPSIQGLVSYQARPLSETARYLSLEHIEADNKVLQRSRSIPRNTKTLSFVFKDIDFNSFENVFYQYRLTRNGFAQDWSEVQKGRDVLINYPEFGHYTIDFRRLDARNLRMPVQISHSFYVEPLFHETIWFIFLSFLTLVAFISFITWYYIKQKQQVLQYEREMQHTITELQLSSIQSRMNPHFMFNAMNVLVHMINLSTKKKAEEYAISFARLMRQVLEQSSKSFITIEEEVNTLENYLFIQKQRLGKDFTYEITCPQRLKKVLIPTMIVQPFVENSIIHGISHINNPGHVSVRFVEQDLFWQIEISDNGIGRKNASKMQKSKTKTSQGISLVQKKLELLKSRDKLDISILFIDLVDKEKSGTKVIVKRLS